MDKYKMIYKKELTPKIELPEAEIVLIDLLSKEIKKIIRKHLPKEEDTVWLHYEKNPGKYGEIIIQLKDKSLKLTQQLMIKKSIWRGYRAVKN